MDLHFSMRHRAAKFFRDDSGTALVEFALLLPILLLLFAVTIEGGRLMWSYQSVNAGVRDAARYLARVAPADICSTGGSVTPFTSELEDIVRNTIGDSPYLPVGITVVSVTPSLNCVIGTYRVSPAPVAQVSATLRVTFPFASVFSFNGGSQGTLTKTISDQSRVFGT